MKEFIQDEDFPIFPVFPDFSPILRIPEFPAILGVKNRIYRQKIKKPGRYVKEHTFFYNYLSIILKKKSHLVHFLFHSQ